MKIADKYLQIQGVQDYRARGTIDGVELVENRWFSTTDGNFAEILRYDEGRVKLVNQDFVIKQLSWSYVLPGSVKAYHYHEHQKDLWFCPPTDRLIVNLHDLREDSPTFDQHQTIVLGAGKNHILVIPEGVAHGCGNPYTRPMSLFYAVTAQFNPDAPDEKRLAWDSFGAHVWEIEKG
ncbi:dTDP-4-dehydrorhamnose 3,5-epimerase family protein [bacterium]|nr:dTDP-4-dehydrorhamnose 3,5-epimerase family protein [bacterium]